MQWSERRERFRAILGGARCVPPAELVNIASPALLQQLSRDADYARWTREFLG